MPEPTILCSAPLSATPAESTALYSHYVALGASALGTGVMIFRAKQHSVVPHVFGAIAMFGIFATVFYSQATYNYFLYQESANAIQAVAPRAGAWAIWAAMLCLMTQNVPGFFFKKIKDGALFIWLALAVIGFVLSAIGLGFVSEIMTTIGQTGTKDVAMPKAMMFAIPSLVISVASAVVYFISQSGNTGKDSPQMRVGVMISLSLLVSSVMYAIGCFFIASSEDGNGIHKAVLMINCGDLFGVMFAIAATFSIFGTAKQFAPKVKKSQSQPQQAVQQNSYAQQQALYQQQLLAQQQAYAYQQQQLYAQQQAAYQQQLLAQQQAATQNQTPASQKSANSETPAQATQAAEQSPGYNQQQAYSQAYQQQQAAYQQQVYQQQMAYAQQQAYMQAYQQQQAAYQQQHQVAHQQQAGAVKPNTTPLRPTKPGVPQRPGAAPANVTPTMPGEMAKPEAKKEPPKDNAYRQRGPRKLVRPGQK